MSSNCLGSVVNEAGDGDGAVALVTAAGALLLLSASNVEVAGDVRTPIAIDFGRAMLDTLRFRLL
jgi:hypothetical protein